MIEGLLRPYSRPISRCFFLMCTLAFAGCTNMIFYNDNTIHLASIETLLPPAEILSVENKPSQKVMRPLKQKRKTINYQVKTSENLWGYFSGKSASSNVSQWCGNHPWVRIKTKQSPMDIFVRWLASPFYAINSLEVDCQIYQESKTVSQVLR